MKALFVAYDVRELYKKSELKIVKIEYVKSCSKWPLTQIWSLKILGVKGVISHVWLLMSFVYFFVITPKVLRVFFIKTTSKQPLLKARWILQTWGLL
jgi:hypothetical protein